MDITEDLLYSEIGRQVVRGRVLEANLRAAITESRRQAQEIEDLQAQTTMAAEIASETVSGT